MSEAVSGACFCRRVEFRIELPTLWCAHCHCSMCRRSHGAGFVTWVGAKDERFAVTAGESFLRWFESSTGARRGFCTECGSTFLFKSERWPGETHVTLANIDDDIDREPAGHAFEDDRVRWVNLVKPVTAE